MAKAYRAALSALVIGSALAGTVGAARAETLADAIALAYQTNPTLQAQRAQVRFQDEQYVQARAQYRPTVAGSIQALHETQYINPCVGNPFTGGCTDASPEFNQITATVTMTQPLYTSGKATATVNQAEADILTQRETLRTTENQVLADTITAYVDVRRDQQALAIHLDDVNAMKQQVADARARFEVGEVTKTDVAQAETYLAQSQAAFSVAQAQLALSRASYAQTVGQSPGELAPEPELTLLPKTIDQAFETATQNAPAIRSAGYAVQSAEAQIAEAKAGLGPTLSLQAVFGQVNNNLKPLVLQNYNRRVDLALVLSQPIYAGGLHESQVRQAVERQNFYRIQEETARRTVIQTLSQAWNRMLAAQASIAAGTEQVRAARLAYEGATEEEKAGLRTTFEVLQQEQILASAELSLNSARHDAYAATAQVLQVAGLLEARLLVPDIAVQPGGHDFHRLKNVTGYVPWEEAIKRIDQVGVKPIHEAPPPLNAPIDAPIPTAAPADAPTGGK